MKPGRNEPCPCGSGEKFKKCCGKVIPLMPAAPPPRPMLAKASPPDFDAAVPPGAHPAGAKQGAIALIAVASPGVASSGFALPGAPSDTVSSGATSANAPRSCGECTACCDGWLAGSIKGHDMKPGVPCHFVREGSCSIYEDRPQSPCRNFSCAWVLDGSPFGDGFRPDRLGVVIVPIQWRDCPAYLLVSAGRDPDAELIAQMEHFSMQTRRPFFYEQAGKKIGFGPPLFQQDMLQRLESGQPMW